VRQVIVLFTILFLTSCAVERPQGKTEAEVLYKEAQELMADKRFLLATEKLNTLRSQYPYSYYATSAELTLADILFMQENYEESAAAYILFKDFHPKHRKIDYVIFKIAESYYNQKPPTFDRDLAPAIKAIKYYNELRSLYPSSKFLKDADKKIKKCNEMLISKEKYIADFYFRTKDYDSAKFRYSNMVRAFHEKEIKSVAAMRLLEIGQKTNDDKLCRKVYAKYKVSFSKKERKSAEKVYFGCIKK